MDYANKTMSDVLKLAQENGIDLKIEFEPVYTRKHFYDGVIIRFEMGRFKYMHHFPMSQLDEIVGSERQFESVVYELLYRFIGHEENYCMEDRSNDFVFWNNGNEVDLK